MISLLWLLPAAMAEDGGTVRHHVAQARQFVKNHWYDDAALEIEAALALPEGPGNFDVNWLGAQIYYELVDIDRALPLAERAAAVADTDPAREQATGFADFLRTSFGFLDVRGPYDGMTSRLQIEGTSVQFDADLKRLVNKIALQKRDPTPLPARFALPVGDYLVNGVAVTVTPQATTRLPLDMAQLGARGFAALQVTRLEIAAGTSVLFGERVDNLRPGVAFELSLTQPIGPILLGVVGDYDLRSYSAGASRSASDPYSWSAGVRIGREFVLGGPLDVRPSLGVRYGLVPGIGLGCDRGGDDVFVCSPLEASSTPAVEIYTIGRSVTPFVELAVEYREAGRTTALGVGVKAVVEQYVGTVASPGDAVLYDDTNATPLPYTAAPATWSATGVRLLANLSIAF